MFCQVMPQEKKTFKHFNETKKVTQKFKLI